MKSSTSDHIGDARASHSSAAPPVLPSPRHGRNLSANTTHLTLSPPSHSPEAVSSAKLSINVTDAMLVFHQEDHVSRSAPPVDTEDGEGEERVPQSQPHSGGVQWTGSKGEGGWAHAGHLEEEEEELLLQPLQLNHSVSSPVELLVGRRLGEGEREEKQEP